MCNNSTVKILCFNDDIMIPNEQLKLIYKFEKLQLSNKEHIFYFYILNNYTK